MKITLKDRERKRTANAEKKAAADLQRLTKRDSTNLLSAMDSRIQVAMTKIQGANASLIVPTEESAENTLKREQSNAEFQSPLTGAKSRKDTRSAELQTIAQW